MHCRIDLTVATDRPYLIKWDQFAQCLDHDDFGCRESFIIRDRYLAGWWSVVGGERRFSLPAFYLSKRRALFIDGRHRTALLSRHLTVVPLALTQSDLLSADVLQRIVLRPIGLDEMISLPDLPIVDSIPR
jgi:hypothetical protein